MTCGMESDRAANVVCGAPAAEFVNVVVETAGGVLVDAVLHLCADHAHRVTAG